MAGGLEKILGILGFVDEDEYDDDFDDDISEDEYAQEAELDQKQNSRHGKKAGKRGYKSSYSESEDDYFSDSPYPSRGTSKSTFAPAGKVVPIHGAAESSGWEVSIVRPANFGESQQVCDILLNGQPVVVNLEGIDISEAQRIMDFISGCIFSISGNMRQISRYIFIFAPKSVDISGDYMNNFSVNDDRINIPTLNKEF